MTELPAHSPIGASSMKRWQACPGSVPLSAGIVQQSSEYAEEGSDAHFLAERCLLNTMNPIAAVGQTLVRIANGVDRKFDVTQEMAEAVQVYVDEVRRDLDMTESRGAHLLIEHKFHLKDIHHNLFGTADCVIYRPATKTLAVKDYKHGAGVAVEVEGNPQFPYYALGALLETGYPAEWIEMTVVQPRCPHPKGPIRSHRILAVDLLDWAADLKDAVLRVEYAQSAFDKGGVQAMLDLVLLRPGEDQCRWCAAAAICPAIRQRAQAVAKNEFRSDLSYDPKVLAEVMAELPMIEDWCKSVREFAYAEAGHGRTPPGWKLVNKVARRKWRDAAEAKAALILYGFDEKDILTEPELKSPAQAEDSLCGVATAMVTDTKEIKAKKKAIKDLVKGLAVSESSGTTLAPESDPREPVVKDAASEFFGRDVVKIQT